MYLAQNFNTFLLSKFLPLVFSPLGIVLILLFLFIIRRKNKFIYSVYLLLIVFSNGIISNGLWRLLEYPWQRLDYSEVDYAEGIVVLSNGRHLPPGNSKIIEWHDSDRFFAGINLYKANKSSKLIFTGGINPLSSALPPEGDIYIQEALELGIPKEDLFTTTPVMNTNQEAKAIKKLLSDQIITSKKIILVTSAFHMKRAKRLFEREGIIVLPYPVDFKSNKSLLAAFNNPLKWAPSSSHFAQSSSAIREIIGLIFYRLW